MFRLYSAQIIKLKKTLDEGFDRVGKMNFSYHKFIFSRTKDERKDSLHRNHFKKSKIFFIYHVQNPKVKKQTFDEKCNDKNSTLLQN